jgi:hypothetical protein
MRLYLKIKREQVKILAHKAGQEIKKLALAIVITEFVLAGSFAAIVNYTNIAEIAQIQPIQAKTKHLNELQGAQKKQDKPSIEETDENKEVEEIADIIYTLESSRGKNDAKCERIGKHNGYGYSQGVDRNFCLNSDDEMRQVVIKWIKDKQSKNLSKREMLCYYNSGVISDTCNYIADIL